MRERETEREEKKERERDRGRFPTVKLELVFKLYRESHSKKHRDGHKYRTRTQDTATL